MFFKKKPNHLQPKLEEALELVYQVTHLVSCYFYEENYQPTEAELTLFQALKRRCFQAYGYTDYVAGVLKEPCGYKKEPN